MSENLIDLLRREERAAMSEGLDAWAGLLSDAADELEEATDLLDRALSTDWCAGRKVDRNDRPACGECVTCRAHRLLVRQGKRAEVTR